MFRILIVDDDRDICEIISNFLKEEGYTVNVAYDGESALRRIKTERYDLMILEYNLPGIAGLQVLEEVLQIKPSLAAIVISAFGNGSVRSKAKELGAYDFLDKPFDINELLKDCKLALGKKP